MPRDQSAGIIPKISARNGPTGSSGGSRQFRFDTVDKEDLTDVLEQHQAKRITFLTSSRGGADTGFFNRVLQDTDLAHQDILELYSNPQTKSKASPETSEISRGPIS